MFFILSFRLFSYTTTTHQTDPLSTKKNVIKNERKRIEESHDKPYTKLEINGYPINIALRVQNQRLLPSKHATPVSNERTAEGTVKLI